MRGPQEADGAVCFMATVAADEEVCVASVPHELHHAVGADGMAAAPNELHPVDAREVAV